MRKKIMTGSLLLVMVAFVCNHYLEHVHPGRPLVIACRANVHFTLNENRVMTSLDGHISLITLNDSRLAMRFSGQMVTPEGHFLLNRILMMDYRYYPENHALELHYRDSSISSADTTPDAVFFQRLFRSHNLLLRLTRFTAQSWLIAGLDTPLYLCTDSE